LVKRWGRLMRQFVYTGFSLNTDGLEIYNKYMNFEIDSIRELNDKKYYVKSLQFPEKIVSIGNWIKVVEKLHSSKKVYKGKMRRADTEMMTGIFECPYCELRYYFGIDKGFHYYRHFSKHSCKQRPKSFRVEKINKMMDLFYFYFFLVYDDTKDLIKESQRILKLNLLEVREKVKSIETENRKHEKQVRMFQSVYEDFKDEETLKLTLIKEAELNKKIEGNNVIIGSLKKEMEEINKKYDNDKMEMTFYDVKSTVISFIEKMSVEEKRASLINVIKKCQIFNKFMVIETGKLLFVFNTENDYFIPEDVYQDFKRDKRYKHNFLNSSNPSYIFLYDEMIFLSARYFIIISTGNFSSRGINEISSIFHCPKPDMLVSASIASQN